LIGGPLAVGGDDDRDAAVVKIAQRVQPGAGAHVHNGDPFAHQQQFRAAGQGAGDEHALLPSAHELANVTVAIGPEAQHILFATVDDLFNLALSTLSMAVGLILPAGVYGYFKERPAS